MKRPLFAAVLILASASGLADAQVWPRGGQPPAPRDTVRAVRDTIPARRDTIPPRADTIPGRRDTLRAPGERAEAPITWVPEDSIARALLARRGYTTTRYQGPVITFDAPTRGIAVTIGPGDTANVAVQRADRLIVADSSISYSEASGRAVATGEVFFREGQQDLRGTGGEYNLRERSVVIRGGRTQVRTEENWYVSADVLNVVQVDSVGNQQNSFGRHGNLTSCDLAEHGGVPHYHFAFRELKRTAGNTLVARPAVLYISDIPVMWLPFVFQDMRPGRHSGILTPTFSFQNFIRNSP